MASEQRGYRSYLLRLWQAGNGDAPEWRIVLEDVRTRERHSFASVDQLADFLRVQMHNYATGGDTSIRRQLADDEPA
jgi:hypothetical protein